MESPQSEGGNVYPVHVIHVVFSLEPGGMENGVVNLANHLDPLSFKTTVCCLDMPGRFSERLRPGVELQSFARGSGFSAKLVGQVASFVRQRATGPTVLHTHNLGPLIYGAAAKICARLRVGLLHGEHAELHGAELDLKRRVQRRILYGFCRRLHGVSQSVKDQLVSLGHRGAKIDVVLNGVDCERFSPSKDPIEAKRLLGLPGESVVIGYVARFSPSKRHALLLDSFASIGREFEAAHLILVGDGGPTKGEVLSQIDSHPLRERIHWLGFHQDTSPIYQAMDILAMPSLHEGLANVLLEAMATGVPCLAHQACGASEVIVNGRNGLLINAQETEEFTSSLGSLLRQPTFLKRLGNEARKTAVERFSLASMISGYSQLYRSVAAF